LLASHTGHFTPRERVPSKHLTGGWVGPRAGLDTAAKKKNSCQESNPGHPACSPIAIMAPLTK